MIFVKNITLKKDSEVCVGFNNKWNTLFHYNFNICISNEIYMKIHNHLYKYYLIFEYHADMKWISYKRYLYKCNNKINYDEDTQNLFYMYFYFNKKIYMKK